MPQLLVTFTIRCLVAVVPLFFLFFFNYKVQPDTSTTLFIYVAVYFFFRWANFIVALSNIIEKKRGDSAHRPEWESTFFSSHITLNKTNSRATKFNDSVACVFSIKYTCSLRIVSSQCYYTNRISSCILHILNMLWNTKLQYDTNHGELVQSNKWEFKIKTHFFFLSIFYTSQLEKLTREKIL